MCVRKVFELLDALIMANQQGEFSHLKEVFAGFMPDKHQSVITTLSIGKWSEEYLSE